jgi:hypothetical protein
MDTRQALEYLREQIRTSDGSHCPKHSGLYVGLCDIVENYSCENCWVLVITMYLRGEIEFDGVNS